MNGQPLISVIIPVYNVEQYLPQCLDSIIYQTYPNLEIICVNDGTRDSSRKILGHYAEKDCSIICHGPRKMRIECPVDNCVSRK